MAIITVHHWDDPAAGLEEMARVARERVVVLTFLALWDRPEMHLDPKYAAAAAAASDTQWTTPRSNTASTPYRQT